MKKYDESLLYGRLITCTENKLSQLPKKVNIEPAIHKNQCGRCHSFILNEWQLPDNVLYCWQCAKLGRITSQDYLVTIPEPNDFVIPESPCIWSGKLTSLQQRIASQQIESLIDNRSHLTYAVTGAGKTEMLFPMLSLAIKQGKRIAIVSPRVDVVLELRKRIKQSFQLSFITLYGGTEDTYQYTQLVLATTHQLFKFKAAFDLIVIDEVDAFPYANNPFLIGAVKQAKKNNGIIFYLTATLNIALKKMINKKQVKLSMLPRRFHGYCLPNIQLERVGAWRKKIPHKLIKQMNKLKQLGIKFLLFVPEVIDVTNILMQLKNTALKIKSIKIMGTYATDKDRLEKVQKMRDGQLDGLITTTILERGVTFPGIDVLILGGDELIFSTATLIQIAGRCGRSTQRPDGLVKVYVQEKTSALSNAIMEINYLNTLGKLYEM